MQMLAYEHSMYAFISARYVLQHTYVHECKHGYVNMYFFTHMYIACKHAYESDTDLEKPET